MFNNIRPRFPFIRKINLQGHFYLIHHLSQEPSINYVNKIREGGDLKKLQFLSRGRRGASSMLLHEQGRRLVYQFNNVEVILLIVLKLCYVVLGHSKDGEKLQRVACRDEAVDRNVVVERL